MKLVLIGIPGAGKSTQGNLLSKQLGIPYLSTGHIFREISKDKTKLGRYVKETINSGFLIPDEKTIPIVNEYLSRNEYKKGYILDGFPRTLVQAKKFKNNVDKIIYLEIPDKEALWRLTYRDDGIRQDNTVTAIKKRIEIFHKITKPVINFYKRFNRLIIINGMKSIVEVNKEILKSLGKQLVQNQIRNWQRKQKAIIAIVGMPGSGKTEATRFFADKGLPIVSFSDLLNDYIDKHGLTHNEKTHKKLREEWRKKHGMAVFAILSENKLKKTLKKKLIVIIEGLRSWEEYLFIKEKFPKVRIHILGLYADKQKRYKRISERKYRKGMFGEERDIHELIGTNMGPTIAYIDHLIENNGMLEDLKNKLETVYREIYFS